MDERDIWLEKLDNALTIFSEMELAERCINDSADDLIFARKMANEKHHFRFPGRLLVSTIVTGIICFVVGFIVVYCSLIPVYGIEPQYSERIMTGCTFIIVATLAVPIGRLLLLLPKAYVASKIEHEKFIKVRQEELVKLQNKYDIEFDKYKTFMESGRVKSLRVLLPSDYCYPQAVQQLRYYFKNGHADTIKEALQLYDNYLHRQRLEDAANRRAEAAEAAAHYAAETAESSRITAAKANETAFWSLYNAYLTEKISRR